MGTCNLALGACIVHLYELHFILPMSYFERLCIIDGTYITSRALFGELTRETTLS